MSEVVRNVRMLLMFFVLRAFVAVLSKNVSTEVKDTTMDLFMRTSASTIISLEGHINN